MKAIAAKAESKHAIIAGILFSLLNIIFIVTETYWGLLLPFGFALIAAVIFALDKVLLFLVFATPLSIFYYNPDLSVGFTLPTEPILFGVLILFLFRLFYYGNFDLKFVKHPLTIAILVNVLWMFIASITSEIPFVSFKALLGRMWFLAGFYFLMSYIFRNKQKVRLYFWLYMIPLSAVVVYTVIIHAQHGFTKDSATWVMFPFFKEHTSYGAVLAMYIPVAFAFAFLLKQSLNGRVAAILIFFILVVGVVLSYTRAAWVSLVVALVVMILIILRVKVWVLILMMMLSGGLVWHYWYKIENKFEQNREVSSNDLAEHVESISNISSDASNLERVNRWKAALRMFEDKPFLGFGPGTYMFLYAPYQNSHDKTIISTNFGNMGNAHSEYLGPLAESGFVGMLSVVAIVIFTIITGVKAYYKTNDRELKILALVALMGLITYWTHGFLNDFLEMDKAACPVWGFSALLVVLDQHLIKRY